MTLKDLNVARTALIKDRTAARNREKNLTSSLLKRHVRQRFYSIESHLKEIEAAIRSLINADDACAVSSLSWSRRVFLVRVVSPHCSFHPMASPFSERAGRVKAACFREAQPFSLEAFGPVRDIILMG